MLTQRSDWPHQLHEARTGHICHVSFATAFGHALMLYNLAVTSSSSTIQFAEAGGEYGRGKPCLSCPQVRLVHLVSCPGERPTGSIMCRL